MWYDRCLLDIQCILYSGWFPENLCTLYSVLLPTVRRWWPLPRPMMYLFIQIPNLSLSGNNDPCRKNGIKAETTQCHRKYIKMNLYAINIFVRNYIHLGLFIYYVSWCSAPDRKCWPLLAGWWVVGAKIPKCVWYNMWTVILLYF